MNISERIKVLRGKQTREQFSEGTGVSAQTLYKYEKQLSTPTIEFVDFICKKFKINYRWLIAGDGPMHPGEPAPEPQKLVEQPVIPTKTDDQPSRCERLEAELAEERRERRELSAELREVNAENRRLAKEITELIKENAGFKKRKTDEENPFFDERRNISSSDILQHGVPD